MELPIEVKKAMELLDLLEDFDSNDTLNILSFARDLEYLGRHRKDQRENARLMAAYDADRQVETESPLARTSEAAVAEESAC